LTFLRGRYGGPSAARNAGVRATAADLIAFLDADDELEPDALRLMVAALESTPGADFCITDVVRVYPDHEELRCGRPPEGDPLLAILRDNFIQGGGLFRRQDLLDAGLFDESLRIFEDWELYIRLIERGLRPAYVAGPWYRYVLRADSITRDRAAIVEAKRRVLERHHRRLMRAGRPGVRTIYADQMWWLARMHHDHLHRPGAALRCLLEGLRYDPAPWRILRAVRTRSRGRP
jgi:glycosyltransferase involved in cell wall biosynthesis